jgi:hypothetical protein
VIRAAEMKQPDCEVRLFALGNEQEMAISGGAGRGALLDQCPVLFYRAVALPRQVSHDLGVAGVVREQPIRVSGLRRAECEALGFEARRYCE